MGSAPGEGERASISGGHAGREELTSFRRQRKCAVYSSWYVEVGRETLEMPNLSIAPSTHEIGGERLLIDTT